MDIFEQLNAIRKTVKTIQKNIEKNKAAISALEEKGVDFGSVNWTGKNGEQDKLRILRPGSKIDYIGNKPDKVKAALERIERGEKHRSLSSEIEALEGKLKNIHWKLRTMNY